MKYYEIMFAYLLVEIAYVSMQQTANWHKCNLSNSFVESAVSPAYF